MTGLDQTTVEIRTFAPRRVAAVRHQGAYQHIGTAFERIVAWAKSRDLMRQGMEVIGIFYDDPDRLPAERLRSDACLAIPDGAQVNGAPADGEVQMLTIEGGPYAVVTHRGPYSELPAIYRHLYCEWMESSGHRPRPLPCFEIYRNDCSDTKPEDLITEVCVPIL